MTRPRLLESLAHTVIVDVAVGVRHSAAVSEKGQLLTWGNGDFGQLGHGNPEKERELFEQGYDPRTGGVFFMVKRPTVVQSLFGSRVNAVKVACTNFSTAALTDEGTIYTWGNNTDGQCGQDLKAPEHVIVFVDKHQHRSQMQVFMAPKKIEGIPKMQSIFGGGYHYATLDEKDQLYTWGQGQWGKLGHGDSRSLYEPRLVDALQGQIVSDVALGDAHSLANTSLYRLTITGLTADADPIEPFSVFALPIGNAAVWKTKGKSFTAPHSQLSLNAFRSAHLTQVGLPYRAEKDEVLLPKNQYSPELVQSSILLMDRSLHEGEWLKLESTDFDFRVFTCSKGLQLGRAGLTSSIMMPVEGAWEKDDLRDRLCVLEVAARSDARDLATVGMEAMKLVMEAMENKAAACVVALPPGVDEIKDTAALDLHDFVSKDQEEALSDFYYGTTSASHGLELKRHLQAMISDRVQNSIDNLPQDVKDWKQCNEEFTGRIYYHNVATDVKRWAPPIVDLDIAAVIICLKEDAFIQRLKKLLEARPKGIIVCQQSWKPDVELVKLPADMNTDNVPVMMVPFETGDELKNLASVGGEVVVTAEVQQTGGVFAWGNAASGQLALDEIENTRHIEEHINPLTGVQGFYCPYPRYVTHLHENQVTSLGAGQAHSVAVTASGEVFSWGLAEAIGSPSVEGDCVRTPVFVEQLDGLASATGAFGGYKQCLILADLPHAPLSS